jgi:peptide/nickel transport system permease protein
MSQTEILSQKQLVFQRFKKNRSAKIATFFLFFLISLGIFSDFLSPYKPTIAGADRDYINGAPQIPRFWDENGFSVRPFLYSTERTRSIETNFRWVEKVNKEERRYVQFFVKGWEYTFLGITFDRHLFGVDKGQIHIFGTDDTGKDIFSRTLKAIFISLAVGLLGLVIKLFMSLLVGGLAGYFGGWVDSILSAITDAIRTIPPIPLFMALAAFIPDTWSAEMRFFYIATILGMVDFPTLARRLRTHLLSERNQEYILAAQLCGTSTFKIIYKHLLPSFTSYIIVDTLINFPYMILAETSLSFIGLGLQDPVNSIGVMLENATKTDVLLNYQWYYIPTLFFIALVMAFVYVGDGIRDAADPYRVQK